MIISWDTFTIRHPVPVPDSDLVGTYTYGPSLGAILALAARHQPAKVCEIGTGYGETALALAKLLPQSQIFTFDVCRELGGYDTRSRHAMREVRPHSEVGCKLTVENAPNVELIVDGGPVIQDHVKKYAPYQFVFIDWGRTWRDVVDATRLALSVATHDAVLIWGGYWYYCPEVGHFVDLVNDRTGNLICHIGDTRLAFSPLNPDTKERLIAGVMDL
jgi:hypothetical protein